MPLTAIARLVTLFAATFFWGIVARGAETETRFGSRALILRRRDDVVTLIVTFDWEKLFQRARVADGKTFSISLTDRLEQSTISAKASRLRRAMLDGLTPGTRESLMPSDRSHGPQMREIEKLAAFLRDNHPSRFCVGCLGRQLHLSVEAVTMATIELGLSSDYGFTDGKCSRCGRLDALLGLKLTSG